jgi:single stranded DNA-binding protein
MKGTITVLLTDLVNNQCQNSDQVIRSGQVRNRQGDLANIWFSAYGETAKTLEQLPSVHCLCIGDLRFIKDEAQTISMSVESIIPLVVESNFNFPSQITVVGTLGADPEVKYFKSDSNLASFSLAVNSGKDQTDWVKITLWAKAAEIAANYCRKGQQHAVSGRLEFTVGRDGRVFWQVTCSGRGALTLLRNKLPEDQTDQDHSSASMVDEIPF